MNHKSSLKALLKRKSVVRGTFTLSSGQVSNYYLDCKLTTLDPEGAVLTGYTVYELLENNGVRADAIGGPTVGADPIVTAVAAVTWLEKRPMPAFLVRGERKGHGRQKQIEGINVRPGMRVVIVDEVCTTGESTIKALRAAEEAGLEVVAVVSLVDREEGGSAKLREKYNYLPVFTAKELLEDDSEDGRTETTSEHAVGRA
jgi:orotate phosphoribosyltransferase